MTFNVLDSPDQLVDPSILLCGDLACIGRAEVVLANAGRSYLLEDFAEFIDRSTFSIANLETPVVLPGSNPIKKTGPSIGISTSLGEKLATLGFDAFGLANNHILDFGPKSLLHTVDVLNSNGIETTGVGKNTAVAKKTLDLFLGKESIAIICCAEKEFSSATNHKAGAYCPDDIDMLLHVQRTVSQVDHTILFYHCGNEYYNLPSPNLVNRCRRIAELGVSAIICHHTHVSSAFEYYHGVPIVYGTGNFIFDRGKNKLDGWYRGYAVSLSHGTQGNMLDAAIIPYEQFNEKPCVNTIHGQKQNVFLKETEILNEILSSPKELLSHWDKWCNINKEAYIGRLFAMNRISRKVYKTLKYPLLRLSANRRTYLLNLIQCPAHREMLLTLLKNKLD